MTSGVPPPPPPSQFFGFSGQSLPAAEQPAAEQPDAERPLDPKKLARMKKLEQDRRWREKNKEQNQVYMQGYRAARKIGPEAFAAFKKRWCEDHCRKDHPLQGKLKPETVERVVIQIEQQEYEGRKRKAEQRGPEAVKKVERDWQIRRAELGTAKETVRKLLSPKQVPRSDPTASGGRLDAILQTPPPPEHPSASNSENPDDVGQNPSDAWQIPPPPPDNFFPS